VPTPPVDEETLRETVRVLDECAGNQTLAAEKLGMSRGGLQGRLRAAARLGLLQVERPALPGFGITKVSTLYNGEGVPTAQWVQQKPDAAEREEAFKAFVEGLIEPIKGLSPIVQAPPVSDTDLLAVYPIGDHHFGMRADPDETGDPYDCNIARDRLLGAVDRLVTSAPAADEALLLNLGDFFHANDSKDATPESGNRLDVDTRFGQVMFRGGELLVHCVLRLLEKHRTVRVWNMRGNHDPDAAMALTMAIAFYFHNEPRVVVDMGSSLYKFHRFGKNLIASHHGHGAKPNELPLLMAVDRPEDWAATTHRVWHCGHIHHKTLKEHPGVDVETHRCLAGTDAWHAGKGYRSKRDMSVIIYHREHGEIQRTRFDLGMLEAA
jgi:hypothetical protein